MISSAVIEEVRRLLEEQKLSCMIARQVGEPRHVNGSRWQTARSRSASSRRRVPAVILTTCCVRVAEDCAAARLRAGAMLREKTRRGRRLARAVGLM